jgi:integrase
LHDLIPLDTVLLGALTTAEIDATNRLRRGREVGRAAYASDWKDFAIWCAGKGATPLPAHVGIVAAYLSHLADSGRKLSPIDRRAAAIGYRHKLAGYEPPTNNEGVKATLRGIRRIIGSAKQGKAPATADLIGQMIALCPDNMIGKRDRALLALGFAGAFRRSELCALEVADLTEVPDGLRILIRRSKGDQEGQGPEVAIPRGYRLRPVEAVQTWLAAAEINSGPVFRAVALGGKDSNVALANNSASRIEAVRLPSRAGSCVLCRPQPPQWVLLLLLGPGRTRRAPRADRRRGRAGSRGRPAVSVRRRPPAPCTPSGDNLQPW